MNLDFQTEPRAELPRCIRFVVIAALIGLAGCASAADPGAMTVAAVQTQTMAFPQPLAHAMCVRNVTGGEATNPMWASKVDNDGFRAALAASLDTAGLSAAATSCSYPLDVNLLGLSQPALGLDMTVTSHVNYKVYDRSGQPFLMETIDAPYTAKFSDSLVGVKRLRMANEGSIRESIQRLLEKLRASTPR
jgi:hypothetical protein